MPGNGLEKVSWCASASPPEYSFVNRVQQAFTFFGFRLSDTLRLSFAGKRFDAGVGPHAKRHQAFASEACQAQMLP